MNVDYERYRLNKKEKFQYYSLSCFITGILLLIFYDSLIVSLVASPMIAFALQKKYEMHLNNKRKELLKGQFGELLQSLSASISAGRQMGHALEEGLATISRTYPTDSPMVMELSHMVKSMRESREGEEVLLRDFAKRAKIKEISSFVEVYSICRETGGDMEKAIIKTNRLLIEKLSIEKEMKVLSAQKKFEGKLISLMPVIILVFLRVTSSSYIEPLYTTLAGRIIITLSILGIGYAYYLTDKITRVSL